MGETASPFYMVLTQDRKDGGYFSKPSSDTVCADSISSGWFGRGQEMWRFFTLYPSLGRSVVS